MTMKPRVYVETTIPSYNYEVRRDPEAVAKRQWTREWWDNHRHRYELLTGPSVMDELERGRYPSKADTLRLVRGLPLLRVNDEIEEIVAEYISHQLMPRDSGGDALRLALASYYHCRFLVTCRGRGVTSLISPKRAHEAQEGRSGGPGKPLGRVSGPRLVHSPSVFRRVAIAPEKSLDTRGAIP